MVFGFLFWEDFPQHLAAIAPGVLESKRNSWKVTMLETQMLALYGGIPGVRDK